ncbi:butyrophilin subfamily 3 member A3-like isoform X3 [Stegostoma tigrinum]|uniref:butyrophilin subfamily 3 member A3-like isoform X3 n=1 Tax=Stegostoma tigrinum TaxID=3053191 RepID=UPI00286FBDD2|nr:butyrophilin subfamily 3 member A3-like isoform X3 [Stegostoma tigrinum]
MEGVHLILLLLFGIPCSVYGDFRVSGPGRPVVAVVGEDAVLECYLVPKVFANNMVVRWFKSGIRLPVHSYRNGQDNTAAQHEDYKKRTELFKDEVSKGNVSLRIKNIRVFDEGKYLCTIDDKTAFEETTIELKVGAVGREHWIQVDGYHKNGIRLVCESNGWFPQPQISWTGGNGQNLTAKSEINNRRDSKGLVNVQSSVIVTKDPTNNFKCLTHNHLLKEEQKADIQIAELRHDKTIEQYGRWKSVSDSDWKNISKCKVPVNLDAETANPKLEVSKDRKKVRLTQTALSVDNNEERFTVLESVLGSEEFTSGSHYWEVDVVGNQHWTVGVATLSVERKKEIQVKAENGLWTIGRAGDKFQANAENTIDIQAGEVPTKIGVYLSYETGTVSFYSADTKIYLHTFTGCGFTEKLYPFFSTTVCNTWLRICPV